jgi:uncharacterized protein YxjI
MEIKIQCACGTKFKFDVEPANGMMPAPVHCPTCNADATVASNVAISQNRQTTLTAPVPPVGGIRLRVAGAATPFEAAESSSALSANRRLLERTTFFVKERVAMLKLTDTYDILDPATGQSIGLAKEEPPTWAKWLRLVVNKQMLPTVVNIYECEGQPPVLSIQRGFTFLRSKVRVIAGHGESLGYFKSKLLSLGGGFNVFDNADQQVAEVKGNWKGWDFRFLSKSGREIGTVTKKWAGLGKELFTSADNYVISLTDLAGAGPAASALLLAAGLSIDIVLNENN